MIEPSPGGRAGRQIQKPDTWASLDASSYEIALDNLLSIPEWFSDVYLHSVNRVESPRPPAVQAGQD